MHNVFITGSTGFIGSRLCQRLDELGIAYTRCRERLDLFPSDESSALDLKQYDTVFHLAGLVGGMPFNMANPVNMLSVNLKITLNILDAWVRAKTPKLIIPGSACSYPDQASFVKPYPEALYLQGEPHWSNIEYGYTKRTILVALRGYAEQYNLDYAYPILANVYGPGVKFHPHKLHVIPALAYKFLDTSKPVQVLGSGVAIRDYLYIDDAVEALIHSAVSKPSCWAVNYGTNKGHSVTDIVDKFSALTGRQDIDYLRDEPEGQMYRVLDCRLANARGWTPNIGFDEGLERTMQWVKTASKS